MELFRPIKATTAKTHVWVANTENTPGLQPRKTKMSNRSFDRFSWRGYTVRKIDRNFDFGSKFDRSLTSLLNNFLFFSTEKLEKMDWYRKHLNSKNPNFASSPISSVPLVQHFALNLHPHRHLKNFWGLRFLFPLVYVPVMPKCPSTDRTCLNQKCLLLVNSLVFDTCEAKTLQKGTDTEPHIVLSDPSQLLVSKEPLRFLFP